MYLARLLLSTSRMSHEEEVRELPIQQLPTSIGTSVCSLVDYVIWYPFSSATATFLSSFSSSLLQGKKILLLSPFCDSAFSPWPSLFWAALELQR